MSPAIALSVSVARVWEPSPLADGALAECFHGAPVLDARTTETYCVDCGAVLAPPVAVAHRPPPPASERAEGGVLALSLGASDPIARLFAGAAVLADRERRKYERDRGADDYRTVARTLEALARLALPAHVAADVVRVAHAAREAGIAHRGGLEATEDQVAAAALIVLRTIPRLAPIAELGRVAEAVGANPTTTRRLMRRELEHAERLGIDRKAVRPAAFTSLRALIECDSAIGEAIRTLLTGVERERLRRWLANPESAQRIARITDGFKREAVLAALVMEASDEVLPGRRRVGITRAARAFGTTELTVRKARERVAGAVGA